MSVATVLSWNDMVSSRVRSVIRDERAFAVLMIAVSILLFLLILRSERSDPG